MKKTTLRTTANPRRSTLVHLADAAQLGRGAQPEYAAELPGRTANPRPHRPHAAPGPVRARPVRHGRPLTDAPRPGPAPTGPCARTSPFGGPSPR